MDPVSSKVLVVDDDPAMLRMLSRWLEKAGYTVQVACDGLQALAAIESDCPDFLITDWEMPKMDGLELCRRVRALNLPHYIFILFLTVKSASEEMVAGLEVGADEFLCKPIYQEEFIARLRAGSRVLELERRLNALARIDPLTGLMTQGSFYEVLGKEWHRTTRSHLSLSCVMLNLDHFKTINDIHGHTSGDVVLKHIAELLKDNTRRSDTVCRYGGETFCILLPETDEFNTVTWAERIRLKMANLSIPVGEKTVLLSGSFGISQRYEDTQTPEMLVDQADQALLCAKRTGRNRTICFQSLNDAGEMNLIDADIDIFNGILARHIMTPAVMCLKESDTVGQAAEFFLRSRTNSTPVVNDQGEIVGMLSDKDLMTAMGSLEYWKRRLSLVMRPNVITFEEDTPIRIIYEFLCRVSLRRVVIVKDQCPTGTISRSTLLRLYRNLVVSKKLLPDKEDTDTNLDIDPLHCRERLTETTRELASQVSQLQSSLHDEKEDVIPFVVGGATRIQTLVTDLLAYSNVSDPLECAVADLQTVIAEDK